MTSNDPPQPGSIHHFALLYTPAEARAACGALLGIEREIRASLQPSLDHGVAHLRLGWWQEECARTLAGSPAHPLMRMVGEAMAAQRAQADLRGLVHAAAADLARSPLPDAAARRHYGSAAVGTVFRNWAQLVAANASQCERALELGTTLGSVQCVPSQPAVHADLQPLQRQIAGLDGATQRRLRPLCVWVTLACRRLRRNDPASADHASGSWREVLAHSMLAWRCARASDHGQFRLKT